MIISNIAKHDAFHGIFHLDDLLDEVLDEWDPDLLYEDKKDYEPSDYGMLNSDLFNLNSDEQGDPKPTIYCACCFKFHMKGIITVISILWIVFPVEWRATKTIQLYHDIFSGVKGMSEQKEWCWWS